MVKLTGKPDVNKMIFNRRKKFMNRVSLNNKSNDVLRQEVTDSN
jgi:hypothetical protein